VRQSHFNELNQTMSGLVEVQLTHTFRNLNRVCPFLARPYPCLFMLLMP